MAVFNAVFEYPDIRFPVFAYAGGDEVGIGDIPDARRLGIFIPSLLGYREHYFFHFGLHLRIFLAGFGKGEGAQNGKGR